MRLFNKNEIEQKFTLLVRYPLVLLGLSCLITIFIANEVCKEMTVLLLAVCVLAALGFLWKKKLLVVALGAALAISWCSKFELKGPDHVSNFLEEELNFEGRITSRPYTKGQNKIFNFRPEAAVIKDKQFKINGGELQVSLNKFSDIELGDVITFKAVAKKPEVLEGFDYPAYLKTLDVYGLVKNPQNIQILKHDNSVITFVINNFRNNLEQKIRENLPEPHAALLLGMLIGNREEFAGGFDESLEATGTTHIIAVSGFNISLVIAGILSLAGMLPRRQLLILAIPALLLFQAVVGFDNIPALRATLMGIAVIWGQLLGRRGSVYSTLSLSVLILLADNPYIYKSISFQLSYAAVMGLLLLQSKIKSLLPDIFGFVRDELSITLAATIMTLPVIVNNFGVISYISPLVNVLIAPLVMQIMLSGLLFVLAGLIFQQFTALVAVLVWAPLELMIKIIQFFARTGVIELEDTNDGNITLLNISMLVLISWLLLKKSKYE